MIKRFSNLITSMLLKERIIDENDMEIYQFGTRRILKNLLVLLVVCITATVFNVWVETLCLMIGFAPLRKIAGGYHADTLFGCNLVTFSTYILDLLIIRKMINYISIQVFSILCFVTIVLIFCFAPVDHKNLKFSYERQAKAKKYGRIIILSLVLILNIIIYKVGAINILSFSIILGAFTASISIFVGNIKRRREEYEEIKIFK